MDEARTRGVIDVERNTELLFKAYLRRPELRATVQARLHQAFGPQHPILFLQADICRRELLLEIEAVCMARTRSS
jgi:hypothetical protein